MMPRTQIIGLDKPVVQPLRSSTEPLGTLRGQASGHEKHRLDSVAEVAAIVSVMVVKQVLIGYEVVTVGPAVFQFGTGVRSDHTQAAHCLPGQIEFNGRPIHMSTGWDESLLGRLGVKPLALSSKLRNLSGRTDAVDAT